MIIRPERPDEADAIGRLVTGAFRDAPHADGTEAAIVDGLRAARALILSLVALDAGRLVGHVGVSPITISGVAGNWYGLGPLSVARGHRCRGIGAALVRAALAELRRSGSAGCVVLGDPAYYGRFGFHADPALFLPGVPPAYFQALAFAGRAAGEVGYHPAFYPAAEEQPATH